MSELPRAKSVGREAGVNKAKGAAAAAGLAFSEGEVLSFVDRDPALGTDVSYEVHHAGMDTASATSEAKVCKAVLRAGAKFPWYVPLFAHGDQQIHTPVSKALINPPVLV